MDDILLSVIIPMYNSEQYILELLEGIQKKYIDNDLELIVIDDGSTDSSVGKVVKFFKDTNINGKVIESPHLGASVARNLGIEKAKGQYILFCDSDDLLSENIMNIVKTSIKEDIDIISMEKNVKIEHDQHIYSNKNDILKFAYSMFGGDKYGISSQELGIGPVRKLYKREFLVTNKIFFPKGIKCWEDGIFNLKAIACARSVKLIRKEMYIVRNNPNSTSHSINGKVCKSADEVLNLSKIIIKEIPQNFQIDVFNQERAFILWELFGKYFIYNYDYKLYKSLKNYKSLKKLENYGVNLQSKLLILSLQIFGFYPTTFWYKYAKKAKNKIEKKKEWF